MWKWKTAKTLTKRVKLQVEGGATYWGLSDVRASVEIAVDWDRLAKRLGQKAIENSSGQSKLMDGIITVTAKEVAL